ncbi:MAG TPA: PQQ-dependent sugar dehydrogenase [Sandaracinaceae bacterium]
MRRLLLGPSIALVLASCDVPSGSAQREHGERGSGGGACELVEEGFGPRGTVPVRAEEVANGLEVPWGILFLEGGDLLVTERPGRLRLVRDGRLEPEPLATIDAVHAGEGGLLGIAAHPDFERNGRFYLYVTARTRGGAANRVEEWRLVPDRDAPRAERVGTILEGIPAARFHDGGRLRVGPDRMLYVATGDARSPRLAQDRQSLAGKILRLRLDGAEAGARPEVFALGVRNVQGFDWREDGALVVTDHGPSGEFGRRGLDEVSVVRRGANLGWPEVSGCDAHEGMVRPSLTWRAAAPPGGAAFYTGSAIAAWRGSLLVGTLGSRHLHRVVFEPGSARVRAHEVYFRNELGRIREVVMGPDGHLYVTTSNCDGRGECPPDGDKIYRIVPS